ncbi:MAG: DNA primase [Thermodesulfobium narugense]|nr:MAG: DNA primase [Thermodesulfobium narugense]
MTDFDYVKKQISITDVIGHYVHLKQRGNSLVGLCPFHNEKTPSFYVSPEKGLFYCFGCKVGGDVFTFLMKLENLTFVEAFKKAASICGVEVSSEFENSSKDQVLRVLKEAGAFFTENLWKESGKDALEYMRSRGFSDDFLKEYEVGFVPEDASELVERLKRLSFSEDIIYKSAIFLNFKEGILRLSGRVSFPIKNVENEIVAFGARLIKNEPDSPKYLNYPDTLVFRKKNTLFLIDKAFEHIKSLRKVILVEGYLDALMMHQKGFKNTVASLGTTLNPSSFKRIDKLVDRLIIMYDSDDAGKIATNRLLNMTDQFTCNLSVASLPEGLDPHDVLTKYGKGAMERIVQNYISGVDFRINLIFSNPSNTIESKRQKYRLAIRELQNLGAEEIEEFVKKVSEKLHVPESRILSDSERMSRKKISGEKIFYNLVNYFDRHILRTIIERPDFYFLLKSFDYSMLFNDEEYLQAAEEIFNMDSFDIDDNILDLSDKTKAKISQIILEDVPIIPDDQWEEILQLAWTRKNMFLLKENLSKDKDAMIEFLELAKKEKELSSKIARING